MIVDIYAREKDGKGKERERLKKQLILIGNKEIKLKFTVPIYLQMEEEICTLDELYDFLRSKERWQEGKLPALISLMSGGAVTAREVIEGSDVATLNELRHEAERVVAEAIRMREKRYDENRVHDETLEELQKKEEKAD